jgi:hypothetical protein
LDARRSGGDATAGEVVDEWIVGALRNVVEVLHANDVRNRLRFRELSWQRTARRAGEKTYGMPNT